MAVGPASMAAVIRAGLARLTAAGVPSPRVDAEVLLAHALGMAVADVRRAAVVGRLVDEPGRTTYHQLLRQREQRVPLQHLTGESTFRRLTLRVGPGVFVPRPETEVVVELALAEAAQWQDRHPVVVDLCAGSGAIALAVKDELPHAEVHAVELSEAAHAWAAANVTRLGLDVDLRLGDATTAFEDLRGQVDLTVSNPPYIPPGAVPVDPEVRDHDPGVALYGGGADGLLIPLAVAARAADLLRAGGVLLMEHADVQGQSLVGALQRAGSWELVGDFRDLAGLPRVTRAVRRPR